MTKKFTLKKTERLKSRKLTEQLFREGKRFTITPFRIFYVIQPAETYTIKFGAGVSSRQFKKAVDRNRIKRLTREAYRLQKSVLEQQLQEKQKALNVFFIYTEKELPAYDLVFQQATKCIDKLITLINK